VTDLRQIPRLADSPEFGTYMSAGWGAPDRAAKVDEGAVAAASAHRARLSEHYPGVTVVIAAGRAPLRSNDTRYEFRPDSNFYWLTGCTAEEAVLVLNPVADGHEAALFLPAPAYPGQTGFFADPARGELWVGAAPGLRDWSVALGLDVAPLRELDAALQRAGQRRGKVELTGALDNETAKREGLQPSADLAQRLSELRMIKDAWEIHQLRSAVHETIRGFRAVVAELPAAIDGRGERWLQGTFDRHARTYGNGPGYSTIVGSGAHTPLLHWARCDGPVRATDVVLLDMGVELSTYYTADITRTFPASGTFSAAQRQVHDLVEKAHRAALAEVRPGKWFTDFHHAAMAVIAQGLHDWDLLRVSVDEALSVTGQQHRRYLVCGIGHHLGLDVHDCAQSRYEAYQGAQLAPGMVLTVEPGLYFHAFDLSVPPELREIGVRIEDDILVTDEGSEVLSQALPIDATGLEQWMRS
jgi:Xaa-Pro aminopeptidase